MLKTVNYWSLVPMINGAIVEIRLTVTYFLPFLCRIMAKQAAKIKVSGTIGDLCFYRLHEEHYARPKKSLAAKRVKHDPAFKGTMKYAALLACASKIASVIYKRLPEDQKSRKKYQAMTGQAMQLIKKKMGIDVIIEILSPGK